MKKPININWHKSYLLCDRESALLPSWASTLDPKDFGLKIISFSVEYEFFKLEVRSDNGCEWVNGTVFGYFVSLSESIEIWPNKSSSKIFALEFFLRLLDFIFDLLVKR